MADFLIRNPPMIGSEGDRKLWSVTGAIVILLGLFGFADGRFTDSAESDRELRQISDVLSDLPLRCDQWIAEPLEMNSDELQIAEASSAILRRYTNKSGDACTVLLLCGRPGPISVHPPTACYKARGYRLINEPCLISPIEVTETANVAEFRNPAGFSDDRVGILWTWIADESCSAPENPRLAFADERALLKLYVTWDRAGDPRKLDDSIPREFFTSFMTVLKRHLKQ